MGNMGYSLLWVVQDCGASWMCKLPASPIYGVGLTAAVLVLALTRHSLSPSTWIREHRAGCLQQSLQARKTRRSLHAPASPHRVLLTSRPRPRLQIISHLGLRIDFFEAMAIATMIPKLGTGLGHRKSKRFQVLYTMSRHGGSITARTAMAETVEAPRRTGGESP